MRALKATLVATLFALGGCGELSNAPFSEGGVRGRLLNAQEGFALVHVFGAPQLRAAVAADGSFELSSVPTGQSTLLLIASSELALRQELTVRPGQIVDLGELTPRPAAYLDLDVDARGDQSVSGGHCSVAGTLYAELPLGSEGERSVGPLPAGCYEVTIAVPGLGSASRELCGAEGQHSSWSLLLPEEGASVPGCAQTGCGAGDICLPDGSCAECAESSACAEGLSCQAGRCEGSVPACAPCEGDHQCGTDGSCQLTSDGSSVCVHPCDGNGQCAEAGFACVGGLCVPSPSDVDGCYGYQQVGSSCASDQECRARGLQNGTCHLGACTFACLEDDDCPRGTQCTDDGTGGLCLAP